MIGVPIFNILREVRVFRSIFTVSSYRPQMKFGARQCFYTCLSFCPQRGWLPSMHHRSHDQHRGVCLQGGLLPWSMGCLPLVGVGRGLQWVGVCIQWGVCIHCPTPWMQTPTNTRKAVVGTYLPGMLSCFQSLCKLRSPIQFNLY